MCILTGTGLNATMFEKTWWLHTLMVCVALRFIIFSSKRRGGTRSRGHIKTTWLVSPKENWPPTGKSGTAYVILKLVFLIFLITTILR